LKIYLINDIFLVEKSIYFQGKFMPTNTVKTVDVVTVPFFARFLEEQATEGTEVPWTYKFPSDLEDR
jgi:hypothetical protein